MPNYLDLTPWHDIIVKTYIDEKKPAKTVAEELKKLGVKYASVSKVKCYLKKMCLMRSPKEATQFRQFKPKLCKICQQPFITTGTASVRHYCLMCAPSKLAIARYREYGLTQIDFDQLFKAQKEQCAICRCSFIHDSIRICVDHCHKTNKVRGLLCDDCNHAIGFLNDDPERAKLAVSYLETV